MEGNPVSYLDPFGLEPLLADELHWFMATMSYIGGLVGIFEPTIGLLIGVAAISFDMGVYINDIITSGYDLEIILNAVVMTLYNGFYFAVGFLSYAQFLDKAAGIMATVASSISYCVDRYLKEKKGEWHTF